VHSFEVQLLEKDSSIRVGWTDCEVGQHGMQVYMEGSLMTIKTDLPEIRIYNYYEPELQTTTKVSIPKSDFPVIRCANYGAEWNVDGKLIADTRQASHEIRVIRGQIREEVESKLSPWIFPFGPFRITKLEFED
jgi:hypothetical protein